MTSPSKRPSGGPRMLVCPACGQDFLQSSTAAMPFCGDRCRIIDLGRWFDEEVGMPHEGDAGDAPVEYRDEYCDETEDG